MLDYAVNQQRNCIRDRLCQLRTPLRRLGLHAEYHDFAGRLAEELKRDHEIRESQLMYGRLSRQTLKRRLFEAKKRSGRFTNIDGIDHQETPDPGDVVKQPKPLRSAVEERDVDRHARIALQPLDGMDADAVVRVNQVAQAKDQGFRHLNLVCIIGEHACPSRPRWVRGRLRPVHPPG